MTERKENRDSSEPLSSKLDQAASVIGKHRILQFTVNGVRLINMVESGDTQLVRNTIGDEAEFEIFTKVPVKEPLPDKEFPSLEDFLQGGSKRAKKISEGYSEYRDAGTPRNKNVGKPITTPEYLRWKETLPSKGDIITAVHRLAEIPPEERPVEGEYSEKVVEFDCLCTHGGVVFMDLVEEDESVSLREEGDPNPNCSQCAGTGRLTHISINDPKANAKPREFTLVNETTEDSIDLVLDLPRLVVNGEMDLDIDLVTRRFSGKQPEYLSEDAAYVVTFQVNQYIAKQAKLIGIDMDRAFVVREGGVVGPEWEFQDWGIRFGWGWNNHNGQFMYSRPKYKDIEILIQQAQSNLRQHGTVILRSAGSEEMNFAEIRSKLEKLGLTLGLGLGFIATEELGIAFYALDQTGKLLGELAVAHRSDVGLEEALQKVRQLV